MPTAGKVHCFIAASVDGYIATENGDLSFLSLVEQEGEDYGYGAFIKNMDAVIVGRATYDKVLSMGVPFPHTNKPCYVITRKERAPIGQITFYTGNLTALVHQLCIENGYQVFVDGGANGDTRIVIEQPGRLPGHFDYPYITWQRHIPL